MSRFFAIKELHGVRLFRGNSHAEAYWWSSSCGITFGQEGRGWRASVALPPFALYLGRDAGKWNDDPREFSLRFHDWTIWLTLRGRPMEWRAGDPWWVRGVHLNLVDLLLGRATCTTETLGTLGCTIPMPEGVYPAKATHERQTWRRARWFKRVRESFWLDIPGGIPHSGKGENSWDCGDDGLWGIGGDTLADAVSRARQSVLRSREKYGPASSEAMTEASSRIAAPTPEETPTP